MTDLPRVTECCGTPTANRRTVEMVRHMPHPPRVTDRYFVTESWQCMVSAFHFGRMQYTTDEIEEN